MIRFVIGAPVAALILSALGCAAEPTPPADAPGASATPAAAAQQAAVSADRRCQTDDDTGSHLRKRTVCTSSGDDAQERNAMYDAQQRQRAQGFNSGSR